MRSFGTQRRTDRKQAIELLRGGPESIARWNSWRFLGREPLRLSYCNLAGADLSGADLAGVDLHASNLRHTKLIGANLTGADLRRCNLEAADLSGAVLRSANLRAANLRAANLVSTDLRSANVRRASFKQARTDEQTLWPDRVNPLGDPAAPPRRRWRRRTDKPFTPSDGNEE